MAISTTDLYDQHGNNVALFDAGFPYGSRHDYVGPVTTLSMFKDNVLVCTTLKKPDGGPEQEKTR